MQDDQVDRWLVKLKSGTTNPRIFGRSTVIKYSLRKLGTWSVMKSKMATVKKKLNEYQIHIWYLFLMQFGTLYWSLVHFTEIRYKLLKLGMLLIIRRPQPGGLSPSPPGSQIRKFVRRWSLQSLPCYSTETSKAHGMCNSRTLNEQLTHW
jgi:hypothetical protein